MMSKIKNKNKNKSRNHYVKFFCYKSEEKETENSKIKIMPKIEY
jgi:hypothetical protein